MTTTVTIAESTPHAFVAVDHGTCKSVGLHAARGSDRFEAPERLRQGVWEHFGGFGAGVSSGLVIQHDHGSAYISDDFRRESTFLGMASSPSLVRGPELDGCASGSSAR